MFENPHGLDELGEDDKAQLKLLYQVYLTSHKFYIEQTLHTM